MFSDEAQEAVEFLSSWKTQRSVKDGFAQTSEIITYEANVQSVHKVNQEVQTDDDEDDKRKLVFVVEDEKPDLVNFIRRVYPDFSQQLQLNITSHAFDGFEVDLDESASGVSCLYTLTNADLLEEELQVTGLSWNSTGSVVAASYGRFDHEDWCTHKSALCTWNIDRRTIDLNKPDATIDLAVLCHAIVNLLPGGEAVHIQEQHEVLVTVLMCLLDWLMVIPVSKLMSKTNEDDNINLLNRVFQVLNMAASNKGPKKKAKQLNISTIISGDGRPIRLGKLQEDDRSSGVLPSSLVEQQPDSGAEDSQDMDGQDTFDFPPKTDSVELTARAVMMHLVNHMGQYPLGAGPSRVDSLISEYEDNPNVDAEELLPSIINSPNIQFFVLNDQVLISLVELPLEESPDFSYVPASTAATQVRLIMRDMTGKNVWDYTLLHGSLSSDIEHHRHNGRGTDAVDNTFPRDGRNSPLDALLKSRKSSTPLPGDRLDELLCDIGSSSQECLLYSDHSLNEPGPSPEGVLSDIECDIIDTVLEQDISEKNRVEDDADDPRLSSPASIPPPFEAPMSPFQLCRFVVSQTGMLASEKRMKIDLLKKNDRFLRELKNLDSRRCRETHKIALLYVAQGQEDKTSIMFNSVGSEEYERFIAGLAWEVDLSKHSGFLGGLENNLSTGTTAPYYCNSTTEVIFHVSTRMPLDSDSNGFNTKVRHLGNDEVHIVWSEHYRDYRHGIVNTEFADVMIVIYPLMNHLFRIQIIKKPKVPMFGPLFDGALVDRKVLPSLVRATAINASRASRELLPLYERYYEERENCIERIVKNHKEPTTYEDFASLVFCPAPRPAGSEPPTPVLSHIVRTQTGAYS